MRACLKKLALEKRKAQRKARALKEKAGKINLADLMQMVMMKAFILSEEKREAASSSSSSSSTEVWKPKNAQDAFNKIFELTNASEREEVASFAKELREEASP